MKVKVIIFDLDDTLYNEIEYVYSGFKAVANYFANLKNINDEQFYTEMVYNLRKDGRGKIFDKVLKKYNIYSKKNIKKSISIYRNHQPNIFLSDENIEILKYFNNKKIPLYIITDGNKIVQEKKIKKLGLEQYIKKNLITHRYGKKNSKPSTYCFEKVAKIEKVQYSDIVYVGDNINKDFINIKKIGFKTIRVLNGMFKNEIKKECYHAQLDIESLKELKNIINNPVKNSLSES